MSANTLSQSHQFPDTTGRWWCHRAPESEWEEMLIKLRSVLRIVWTSVPCGNRTWLTYANPDHSIRLQLDLHLILRLQVVICTVIR